MRALGLIGLLLALLIVGLLVKKQLAPVAPVAVTAAPGAAAAGKAEAAQPQGSPRQIEQQFKQSLDDAMSKQPALPEEAR